MLLEREQELSQLRALVDAAAQEQAGLAIIEGPAGIGKSRLLSEARGHADAVGMRVLHARGGELERELAFGVVRQLLEATISDALLEGAAAPAREVFAGPASGVASDDSSFAILHALYRVIVNLAEDAPLLLVVDDLQWCDEPSLRWLCYLVRRLDGQPVSVLCAVRPFARHAHAHLIGELVRDPLAMHLQPKLLSEPSSAAIVGNDADAAFGHACHAATGGNPLMLVELAKALRAEGVTPDAAHIAAVDAIAPRAVSRAVLVRIGRLPADAAAVARATAVLGDATALPLVAALADLDDGAAVAAAGELVKAEVFADQAALTFVHPLIRAAVYEDIPVHDRSLAHERAAWLLDRQGAGPGPVATQLVHAPPRGEARVVEVLEQAARAAQRSGAPASAVSYLTRALSEPPPSELRAHVLASLGSVENLLYETQSEAHLREALALTADPLARGAVALQLAGTLLMSGRPEQAVELARGTAAGLPPEADVLLAALEGLRMMAAIFGVREPDAAGRVARHRRLPLEPGTGPKILAGVAAHQWAYSGGTATECAPLALAALEGGDVIAGGHLLSSVTATMVVVLADRDEAADVWTALLDQAHASGSLGFKSAVSICRGYTLLRCGELDDAEALLRDGIEELTLASGTNGRVEIAAWLAGIERERGNLAAARRELELVSDPGDGSQAARYWLDSHAEQLLAEMRFEEALAVTRDAAERFAGMHAIDTPTRSHQALALHHLGRRDEALALAAKELEAARHWGAPSIVARALRILGTVEHIDGIAHLREAAEYAAGSPAALDHAKALAALGAALRAGRQPTQAREPLRRALEVADARGATGLATRVRQELYAAGGRPRTTALQGVEALTPSERRIAERAAGGQTNRAIAEALFVTPKTVELHLRNAYRKLGARDRRDLSALLEPMG